MNRVFTWLAPYSWEFVTMQNALLCKAQNALHKPTSTGYQPTMELWKARHTEPMDLYDAIELCRRCHRQAPFCFYNGNTFTAIVRDLLLQLNLPEARFAVVRSLAGHIVAGVSTVEEQAAFRKFCDSLDAASG